MENNCADYFLTNTIMPIFKENDINMLNKILECLYQLHRNVFYKQLFFVKSTVPQHRYEDLIDTAFFEVWESFCQRGRNDELNIAATDYTGYFYQALKKRLFTLVGKELKKIDIEKKRAESIGYDEALIPGIDEQGNFSAKAQRIFKGIGDNCLDLLLLKYFKKLSYIEIANLKNVKVATAKHTVWRCKQTFIERWQSED